MQSPQGDGNKCRPAFDCPPITLFEKCSPRKGTETIMVVQTYAWTAYNNLRNAVPARGRKRRHGKCAVLSRTFEKCSPRKGTET